MSKLTKILDCTLRDGGYYTNWEYSKEFLDEYLDIIVNIPVDIVEVGYINPEQAVARGEYYYLPCNLINSIKSSLRVNQQISVMADVKFITDLQVFFKKIIKLPVGTLIRLTVSPNDSFNISAILKGIKQHGHFSSVNLIHAHNYTQNDPLFHKIITGIEDANVVCLVDSFGSILPHELKELFIFLSSNTSSTIGFHGHNNLELAAANALIAISHGVEVIDSTIGGFGRGAGNLRTELLLMLLERTDNQEIKLADSVIYNLSKADKLVNQLKLKYSWGSLLPYVCSGSRKLPQVDVMKLYEMNRFNTDTILNSILANKTDTTTHLDVQLDSAFEKLLIIVGGENLIDMCYLEKWVEWSDSLCFIGCRSLITYDGLLSKGKSKYLFMGAEEHHKFKDISLFYNQMNHIFCIGNSDDLPVDTGYITEVVCNRTLSNPLECLTNFLEHSNIKRIGIIGLTGGGSGGDAFVAKSLFEETSAELTYFLSLFKGDIFSLTPTNYNLNYKSPYFDFMGDEI